MRADSFIPDAVMVQKEDIFKFLNFNIRQVFNIVNVVGRPFQFEAFLGIMD